jgi:hypothetical protein
MAGSKKNKQIKQNEFPKGKSIAQGGNPEQYYLPRLKALESQTWNEINLSKILLS